MKSIHPNIIRQVFILILIVLTGGLIFREMAPYFSGILGAITLYVLLNQPFSKLLEWGWKKPLAIACLMVASFFAILLPVTGVIFMLGDKIGQAVDNSEKVAAAAKDLFNQWELKFGFDFSSQIDKSSISEWVSGQLQGIAGDTFTALIAISIMYFLLYYMLMNRGRFRESLFEYIPASRENLKEVGGETREMVRANAIGIPLVALAQGLVALIGFIIFGIENPFFWAVIVFIGSMIPFIGNFLGTIPVFILELANNHAFAAWGVLLYGIVIVGSTDNLIRMYVLKKIDNVHPLITLIGVIVGIPLFGFIGLIFGPLLISLFLLIVRIYKKEYYSA